MEALMSGGGREVGSKKGASSQGTLERTLEQIKCWPLEADPSVFLWVEMIVITFIFTPNLTAFQERHKRMEKMLPSPLSFHVITFPHYITGICMTTMQAV